LREVGRSYSELFPFLDLSMGVAKKAAKAVSPESDKAVLIDFRRDVKISADRKLHEAIERDLNKCSPFPVFSEEGDIPGAGTALRWIVDPLDGSLNFSRGIPLYCISIGLWDGMDPVMGVVYDFVRDELFYGVIDHGAWLNGKPIQLGAVKEKKKAVLCTGFPVGTDFSEGNLVRFVEDIRAYKKVRLLGSAALSLVYVASGRADVYSEEDIAVWDVAAGLAIVKAAGGIVRFFPSRRENCLSVIASNEFLAGCNGKGVEE